MQIKDIRAEYMFRLGLEAINPGETVGEHFGVVVAYSEEDAARIVRSDWDAHSVRKAVWVQLWMLPEMLCDPVLFVGGGSTVAF